MAVFARIHLFCFSQYLGIDFLVTVNSDEETESQIDMKHESAEVKSNDDVEQRIIESDELIEDDNDASNIKDEDDQTMRFCDTETRTATASIENGHYDDDYDGDGDAGDDADDDGSSSEHELTNLGWLMDLKNQWPVDSASTANRKHTNGNTHSSLVNGIMNDIDDEGNNMVPAISEKDLSEERFKKFTIQVKQWVAQKNAREKFKEATLR